MEDSFVVVGGDAAGLSAASKCKREDPERDVVVYERGRWISYAHCGTPYYVKGEVEDLTDLLSLSPEEVEERGIDLRRGREVVDVDSDAKEVEVEDTEGDVTTKSYDDLLIASGARAIESPVAGVELAGAYTLHGLDDAAAIRSHLTPPEEHSVDGFTDEVDVERVRRAGEMEPPTSVAVVGGGYVGVEMAEAFSAWPVDIHLYQRPSQLLPEFGEAVGSQVESHLLERGVELHLDTEVEAIRGDGNVEAVETADSVVTEVEMALVGVGVRANVDFVEDEVELGENGAIEVDRYGRTSAADVYAAGDCAESRHAVTGSSAHVPLGLTANRAGRAVGATVAGTPTEVGEIAGTAMVKAFDLECARTGLVTEEEAREHGYTPESVTVDAGSRSGYYPGAEKTTVTLTADVDTGRLLGGAIVGRDRAAVRIDTVATAVEAELTVRETMNLDLGYAPPFSPVWSPVLVAAKVLDGELNS